jgi:tetratricopeptide (TPR) repeat protein
LGDEKPLAVVLGHWTGAVMHHTPGTSDAALTATWAMTPQDRVVIRGHLSEFLQFLDGADYSKARDDQLIVASAALSLFPVGRLEFLERAATLHADAVIFDQRPHAYTAPDPPVGVGRRGRGSESSQQAVFGMSNDGEFQAAVVENPNWPLARLMLDELPTGASSVAFATMWYHGVTAYMLAHHEFGPAERNLDHAVLAMPDSAQALFDLGCVTEALGMSLIQQVVLDDGDPLLRGRPGVISAPRTQPSSRELGARAQDLFERALALDPHLPEARVRWARLLELDKHWSDAAQQIALALSDHPDRDVTFLAHLFGARAADALNQRSEAEIHVAQAMSLFPDAQSALLEASRAALSRDDAVLAGSRLEHLTREGPPAADPWTKYPLGPGRLPDVPMQTLWRAVRRPER